MVEAVFGYCVSRHIGNGDELRQLSRPWPLLRLLAFTGNGKEVWVGGIRDRRGLGGVGLGASGQAWFMGLGPHSCFSLCVSTPVERQPHGQGGRGERLTGSVLLDRVW